MGDSYKDFTEAYKEELKSYVKNTTDTTDRQDAVTYFNNFTITDKKWLGQASAANSVNNTKTFQQHLIDLNEAVASKIDTIFENVNTIDDTEQTTLKDYTDAIKDVKTYLSKCEEAIDSEQGSVSEKGLDNIINTGKNLGYFDKEESEKYKEEVVGVKNKFTAVSSDPVNLSTGNLIYDNEDLAIDGQIPLAFHRYYNSLDEDASVSGRGFVHNYQIRLNKINKNSYDIKLADGQKKHFEKLADGRIVSKYSATETLSENEDGYRLTELTGLSYVFDKDGKLLRQENRNFQGISFEYEEDKLTKATADTGVYLLYKYTDGLLTQVTDNTGRSVVLSYKNNQLTKVELPGNRVFRYDYAEDGSISELTNTRGIVGLSNKYDDENRVVYQQFPDGSEEHFIYDDEAKTVTYVERNGRKVVHVHDERYRNIENIYEDGTNETFLYNDKNLCIKATDRNGNSERFAYDSRGNMTQYIDKCKKKTNYTYDANNCLIAISVNGTELVRNSYDARGNVTGSVNCLGNGIKVKNNAIGKPIEIIYADASKDLFKYDDRGNCVEIVERATGKTTYEYDALNRVVATTDAIGNVTKYTYDVSDNIVAVENPLGQKRLYTYDKSGRIIELEDYDGGKISQVYNRLGRVETYRDKEGNEVHYEYDKLWNICKMTAPDGGVSEYKYNADNYLEEATLPNGGKVSFEYDNVGNKISSVDPLSNRTEYGYDNEGRVISITFANGTVHKNEYDIDGNLVKEIDALGHEKIYKYDELQRLVSFIDELGCETKYVYDAEGNVVQVIYPNNTSDKFKYINGNQLKEVVLASGASEKYDYDAKGRLYSKTNNLGEVTSLKYDCLDRIIEVTNPAGGTRTVGYDANGNATELVDELGHKTQYEYSPNGNLLNVVDALGHKTAYEYDAMGHLVEIIGDADAASPEKVTKYLYDIMGNLTSVINPLGQVEKYSYNLAGNMISKIDRDGYETKMDYTSMGQVKSIDYADGKAVKLSYDALNRLEELNDWTGKTCIKLDAKGRLNEVLNPEGSLVKYKFNEMDQRSVIEYPDGNKAEYSYDEHGLLETLKIGNQSIGYTYDTMGRLISKDMPGVKTSYNYNVLGRVEKLMHVSEHVEDILEFTYDIHGNKVSTKKDRDGVKEQLTYSYDALDRLINVSNADGIIRSYSYDAFGNRLSKTDKKTGAEITYSYNLADQLVEENEAGVLKQYLYDGRGNQVQVKSGNDVLKEFTFDSTNAMTKSNSLGNVTNYVYNGLGQRVATQTGSKVRNFTIDLTRQYHNLLGVTEIKDAVAVNQNFYWDANVVAMAAGDELSFYLQDDLGSPMALINDNSSPLEKYDFDEFGANVIDARNRFIKPEESIQPFGFTGYQKDDSGLYFAQARRYDANGGRFVSVDRLKGQTERPETLNNYSYCLDNPIIYYDLDGRALLAAAIGAGVGLLTGIATQAVTDLITGEKPSLKNYVAAGLGGAAGGAVFGLTGSSAASGAASSAVQTLTTGIWEMADGTREVSWKSVGQLAGETLIDAGAGAVMGKISDSVTKFAGKLAKPLTDKLRITGRGGLDAVYKQMDTKFAKGIIQHMKPKTWLKCIASEAWAAFPSIFTSQVFDGPKAVDKCVTLYKCYS